MTIICRQLNYEGDVFTCACTASNLRTCVFVCISNVCVCVCVYKYSVIVDPFPRFEIFGRDMQQHYLRGQQDFEV